VIFQFFADDATAAEAGRLRSVAKARAEMIFIEELRGFLFWMVRMFAGTSVGPL